MQSQVPKYVLKKFRLVIQQNEKQMQYQPLAIIFFGDRSWLFSLIFT